MNNRYRPVLVEDGFFDNSEGRRPTDAFINDIEFCLQHDKFINNWELHFCQELLGFSMMSVRQQQKLAIIVRKVNLSIDVSKRRR